MHAVGRGGKRVLELDRTARRYHRRREQRRDVRRAGAHRAHRDDRGSATRRSTGGEGSPGGTAAGSADAQHVGKDAERAERRHDRRELAADPAQVLAELAATGAITHVPPCGGVRPQAAVVGDDEFLPDLRARGVARLECLCQAKPGSDQERLDGWDGHAQGVRQIGVGHTAQLAHEQG